MVIRVKVEAFIPVIHIQLVVNNYNKEDEKLTQNTFKKCVILSMERRA